MIVGAQRAGHHSARHAFSGRREPLGDALPVTVRRVDAVRGRVDLEPVSGSSAAARNLYRLPMAKGAKQKKIAPETWPPDYRRPNRTSWLSALECGRSCSARRPSAERWRLGVSQIKDGFAAIQGGELWLHNVHIPPYGPAAREPRARARAQAAARPPPRARPRRSPRRRARPDARAAAPPYFSGPRAKVEIALARGKDLYDKREAIRTRDTQRDMQRALREVGR